MTLATQWTTMGLMLGSGILIGVILDFYRVVTQRFRLKRWIVSLIDLLYWMISSLLVFGLLLWSNWGELRFYLFIAICLGFLLYFRWFSQLVIRFIRVLFQLVEWMIHFLGQAVYTMVYVPLSFMARCLWICARAVARGAWTLIRWICLPLAWLLGPLVRPMWRRMRPHVDQVRSFLRRFGAWWKKKREKGG
ncbi:spore cortex biosynthesis protein YabQ [Laceyella sacchari]|uniref:Spore cortex biosynthesis protein YabQ n=1 Tax=Laceyella sacchari TaxID=37482 RepID=A0ABY5U432_LACSH|nr:spore cortex biosynthesis protein YabQ [Laceyella sacchari]UWE03775.1 spore cortex biosynthesis protein YabQ [Laceyella sacchari]